MQARNSLSGGTEVSERPNTLENLGGGQARCDIGVGERVDAVSWATQRRREMKTEARLNGGDSNGAEGPGEEKDTCSLSSAETHVLEQKVDSLVSRRR